MNRTFSVIRRRANLVDILTPLVSNVATYRLKWATNFDGSFTQFLDSTPMGYFDDTISRNKVELQPTQNQVRIVFNPATFSITDTSQFWLELWQVPIGGSETQVSAPTLILPESMNHGVGIVTVHGTAPSAADTTGSLQLDLPRLMHDIRIHNEEGTGGHSLYVSSMQSGPEQQLQPDTFPQYQIMHATQGSIWVRGGGGTAAFSMVCTLAFPR